MSKVILLIAVCCVCGCGGQGDIFAPEFGDLVSIKVQAGMGLTTVKLPLDIPVPNIGRYAVIIPLPHAAGTKEVNFQTSSGPWGALYENYVESAMITVKPLQAGDTEVEITLERTGPLAGDVLLLYVELWAEVVSNVAQDMVLVRCGQFVRLYREDRELDDAFPGCKGGLMKTGSLDIVVENPGGYHPPPNKVPRYNDYGVPIFD